MDLEKDDFEEENELSGLEEDDELAGDADVVETEEEELIITDEEPEEAAKPAPKAAPKPAAKPAAKKAAAKPAPKPAKKAPAKKPRRRRASRSPRRRPPKSPRRKRSASFFARDPAGMNSGTDGSCWMKSPWLRQGLCFCVSRFAVPFCDRREFEVAQSDPERRYQMRTKRFAKQEDAPVPPLPVVKKAYLKG